MGAHGFGRLVSDQIAAYVQKLSIRRDAKDPAHGFGGLHPLADALMLRHYDPEFLEEIKGIADGTAAAAEVTGARWTWWTSSRWTPRSTSTRWRVPSR